MTTSNNELEPLYLDTEKMEAAELEYRLQAARYLSSRYWRLWRDQEDMIVKLEAQVNKNAEKST